MADSIADRVFDIVAAQMRVEEGTITRDTSFVDDLHIDSLDTGELLAAIEDEFPLTIPNDKVTTLETVGELIDYIADHT